MSKRDWKRWVYAAGIRAVKTIAQTAVATIGVSAAILSVLTSVAGLPELKGEE